MNEIENAITYYFKKRINNSVILSRKIDHYLTLYKSKKYDFSLKEKKIITKKNKKRIVYYYKKDSFEDIMCSHFNFVLSKKFKIKYNDRNKIIKELINCLHVLNDLKDFTIIRFDFKDYFNSISSRYVYEKYIKNSDISRELLYLMEEFFLNTSKCRAGFPTSNLLAELISKEFDIVLKTKLSQYGVIFYERYVDDGLIILNSYIDTDKFKKIINDSIQTVFYDKKYCPKGQKVKINKDKTLVINKRNHLPNKSEEIVYLGYKIFISNINDDKENIKFNFGMSEEKIKKYQNKLNLIIENYISDHKLELLRQRILFFTRRIVYCVHDTNNRNVWISKGIVSNYNELRHFEKILDGSTIDFLKQCVKKGFNKYKVTIPYFIKNNSSLSYELYNNLMKNKSLILDERIGMSKKDLVKNCKKIGIVVNEHEEYDDILDKYLEKIGI